MTVTAAAAIEPGTLVHVAPGGLLLERNIRDAKSDPDLVASVKDLGVLEPIVAVVNTDGALVVRHGHRRALAAVEAALESVPVYVANGDSLESSAEVDRIIRQRDENTQRDGLTSAEEVGVVEQLVAFGLTADQIVDRARVPRRHVDAAVKVSGSKLAAGAAKKYEALTLDQVATVAEFDDDPGAQKDLIVAAIERPEQFAHIAQRKKDDRAAVLAKASVVSRLKQAGVKVLDEALYTYNSTGKAAPLESLMTSPGGKGIKEPSHRDCPGHVSWVQREGSTKDGVPVYEPRYGCSDWKSNGHHHKWASSTGSSRPKADDMSDAEREKAKKARKLVTENNKAWASATTVRRDWLKVFTKQKTPPKGAGAFIARSIATNIAAFTHYSGSATAFAVELLGVTSRTGSSGEGIAAAADKATEPRALMVALVQVLAAYEEQLDNMAWRRDGRTSHAGHYLRFLESVGYPLSDVETFALNSKVVG